MRTMILAAVLALAACGKPAPTDDKKDDKKVEKSDQPATPETRPGPAPVSTAPDETPLGRPLTVEEKAKEAAKIEAKLAIVDTQAAKITEDMKNATTATERETLVGKLEHLQQEKAELHKKLETYQP